MGEIGVLGGSRARTTVRATVLLAAVVLGLGGCSGDDGGAAPKPSASVSAPSATTGYAALYRNLLIPGGGAGNRFTAKSSMDVGLRWLKLSADGRSVTARLAVTVHLDAGEPVQKVSLYNIMGVNPRGALYDPVHRKLYQPLADKSWGTRPDGHDTVDATVADGQTIESDFVFMAPEDAVGVLDVDLADTWPEFTDVPLTRADQPPPTTPVAALGETPSGPPGFGIRAGAVPSLGEAKGLPVDETYYEGDTYDLGVHSLTRDPDGRSMTLQVLFSPHLAPDHPRSVSLYSAYGELSVLPSLLDRRSQTRYDVLEVDSIDGTPGTQWDRSDILKFADDGRSQLLRFVYAAPDGAATFDVTLKDGVAPVRDIALGAATPAPDPVSAARTIAPSERAYVARFALGNVTSLASTKGHVVTLGTDILFAFGSAKLDSDAQQAISSRLAKVPQKASLSVAGYTDSIGSTSSNLTLSKQRAAAVAAAVRAARPDLTVTASGRGESNPVADNGTPANDNPSGRAKNRRVEISWKA